jgi:uncharacterized lipoprotein YajG
MRILLVVLIALMMTGCAFSNLKVNPVPADVSTKLTGGEKREIIVQIPFSDARQSNKRCGMQKNGYNMDTADAICTADPAQKLSELLAQELRSAGFVVKTSDDTNKPSIVKIQGSLVKFFIEPVAGFSTITLETDIQLKLTATSNSGLLAERDFFVKGVESAMVSREENFQLATDDAVKKIIKDMVTAILSLMNRHPSLGSNNQDFIMTSKL